MRLPNIVYLTGVFLIVAGLAQHSVGQESGGCDAGVPGCGKSKAAAARAAAPSGADIQELKDLVEKQQRQIEEQRWQMNQLKSQLEDVQAALRRSGTTDQVTQSESGNAKLTAAAAQQSADEAQRLATQASANAVETKASVIQAINRSQDAERKLSTLEAALNRFRFSGDLRLRGENFFQNCPTCVDRNRARIRVRLGIEGKLGEDFIGGIAIATGPLTDPTTTNTTFTNFFDRKTIGLDKGYIRYQPKLLPGLQVNAGKFSSTWNKTEVIADADLNPEGFDEKYTWGLNVPYVKEATFQTMQLFFNEASGGTDSYALGGQVSAKVQVGRLTSTPSFLLLKWNNPDAILQANAFGVGSTTTTGGGPVPGEGPGCAKGSGLPTVPPCAFGPNGMTNATYLDGTGKPHFWSQYFYADLILNNQIKTSYPRWPLNLLLEYENNLDAQTHPRDNTGALLSGLGKQSHVYFVDVSAGQTKKQNDLQFGYAWLRQEQDSVLASFAASDQRAPTNIVQNRIYGIWKLRSNVSANYTLWFGRTLNSNLQHAALPAGVLPGETEPKLKRQQFDLIYSF